MMIFCKKLSNKFFKLSLVLVSLVLALTGVFIHYSAPVSADQYDEKIRAIQARVEVYNQEAARLAQQAETLQGTVDSLRNQAATLQALIDISQAKYDQLVQQITETEVQIKNNQDSLGQVIADMYVDDNISPIEMLASSRSIGEFMDRQEQRSSIRNQLTSKIADIKELKAQLESQKVDAEMVLEDQKNQKTDLDNNRNEQQRLLNQTRGQESVFQNMVKTSNADIARLRAEQAAANAARARQSGGGYISLPGDGTRGGYYIKWATAPISAMVDYWGMYTRQCVSYAAFKVNQAYGNMPYWGGIGNANQWDDNAYRLGIPTGTTPKPGSVGVVNSGYYGHVGWVESVNSDGTINISHYNINWNGDYAEWHNLRPSFFDVYIYFGEWR